MPRSMVTASLVTAPRHRSTARRIQEVLSVAPTPVPPPPFVAPLPEPVSRYFQFAGLTEQQPAGPIQLEQEGEFRFNREAAWRPFRAVQYVNPAGPAFLWDARIRLFPGVGVRVQDGYCNGVGRLKATVAGLFTVARREDSTTLAAGELHRYLAEAVWNPAALRPEHGIIWDPIDRNSARATLTVKGITVSLDCLFDSGGRLTKAFSRGRYRDIGGGESVLTPWLCEYDDYVQLGRVMVPRRGEVSWLLPDGAMTYCRLQVTRIQRLGSWYAAAGTPVG